MKQCPICLNTEFFQEIVLKERLIEEWELSPIEVSYINRQQGYYCSKCYSNLRSMTLAAAIMRHFSFKGSFIQYTNSSKYKIKKTLEINEAGSIHNYLIKSKNIKFAEYPEVDIQEMKFSDNSFDIVIHSDTLEHVFDTQKAINECFRVLKANGTLFYTIPIIYNRLTKKRNSLPDSYHGSQDESQGNDFKVWTEYGADFWLELISAGFENVNLTLIDNSSIAISAKKIIDEDRNYFHFITFAKLILKKIKRKIKKYIT
jgi:SAM-dependent methyltransferase